MDASVAVGPFCEHQAASQDASIVRVGDKFRGSWWSANDFLWRLCCQPAGCPLSGDGTLWEVKDVLVIQPVLATLALTISSVNGLCQSSHPDSNPPHFIGTDFSSSMPFLTARTRELRHRKVG